MSALSDFGPPNVIEDSQNGTRCLQSSRYCILFVAMMNGIVSLIPLSDFSFLFYWNAGEDNGNPLQYSCLENPMDRGAWQAAVLECKGFPCINSISCDFTKFIDQQFFWLHLKGFLCIQRVICSESFTSFPIWIPFIPTFQISFDFLFYFFSGFLAIQKCIVWKFRSLSLCSNTLLSKCAEKLCTVKKLDSFLYCF